MNVAEIKEKLKDAPDHMDVMIEKTDTEFAVALAAKAEVRKVTFQDGEESAEDDVFVITDEQ